MRKDYLLYFNHSVTHHSQLKRSSIQITQITFSYSKWYYPPSLIFYFHVLKFSIYYLHTLKEIPQWFFLHPFVFWLCNTDPLPYSQFHSFSTEKEIRCDTVINELGKQCYFLSLIDANGPQFHQDSNTWVGQLSSTPSSQLPTSLPFTISIFLHTYIHTWKLTGPHERLFLDNSIWDNFCLDYSPLSSFGSCRMLTKQKHSITKYKYGKILRLAQRM